jgi:hypothetical protein
MYLILNLALPDGTLSIATSEDTDTIQVRVALFGHWLQTTEGHNVPEGYYLLTGDDADEVGDCVAGLGRLVLDGHNADPLRQIGDVLIDHAPEGKR